MKIPVSQIVSATLKKLDENEKFLLPESGYDPVAAPLGDLILSQLEEVAEECIREATLPALTAKSGSSDFCEVSEPVEWYAPGYGSVELPSDFLRLIAFRMSDWKRKVTTPLEYGSMAWQLRFNPDRLLSPGRCATAVAICPGGKGKILEFIGSISPGAYVEFCRYIPRPVVGSDDCLPFPQQLLPALTTALASRVARIQHR